MLMTTTSNAGMVIYELFGGLSLFLEQKQSFKEFRGPILNFRKGFS